MHTAAQNVVTAAAAAAVLLSVVCCSNEQIKPHTMWAGRDRGTQAFSASTQSMQPVPFKSFLPTKHHSPPVSSRPAVQVRSVQPTGGEDVSILSCCLSLQSLKLILEIASASTSLLPPRACQQAQLIGTHSFISPEAGVSTDMDKALRRQQ
jgi:hypothetical protein